MNERESYCKPLFFMIVAILSMIYCTVCQGQDPNDPNAITLDAHVLIDFGTGAGANGDSKFLASAMFYPDYKDDGGIGAIVIGDDTEDGDQQLLLGPGVEFPIGPAYEAALDTILPDQWASSLGSLVELVRPYARSAGLFDEDFKDISPLLGTSFHIRPNSHIQIIPRVDWIHPQGKAKQMFPDGDQWIFSVGAGFAF